MSAASRREMLQLTDWERRRPRYPRTRRLGLSIEAVTLLGCSRDANVPERAKSRLAGPRRNRRNA